MSNSFVSVAPLWIAAALVMGGGIHLARRPVEEPISINQQRLLEVDRVLRAELQRLDLLFENHLRSLAQNISGASARELREARLTLPGVLELVVLRKDAEAVSIGALGKLRRRPRVQIKGSGGNLVPTGVLEIEESMLTEKLEPAMRWMELPGVDHQLLIQQPRREVLIAMVIDMDLVHQAVSQHLKLRLQEVLKPLEDNNEHVVIQMPGGQKLCKVSSSQGPLSMLIPIRTQTGVWQISAWDGVRYAKHWSLPILSTSAALAVLLFLSGVLLHIQQQRVMRLASQRVSFVNRVSHELGTPLTNMELNLSLVRENMEDGPDVVKQRLDLVAGEIQRLSRLVLNVLTFSRVERDALIINSEPCVPDEMICRVLESFKPSLKRLGIEIEEDLNASETRLLDGDALTQIVGNLVSNVEKYAAEGSWMRISARLDDQILTVEVMDRGPGIPERDLGRIFKPFERVHSKLNEGSSGTGLGLSIARGLAEGMGGSLEVLESDRGAHFRLMIPAPMTDEHKT